jgi:DNA-binding transcriptional ArsR family regulator
VRTVLHPDRDALCLSAVFRALGDPVRLEIVRRLAHGQEVPTGGFGLPLAKSSLSYHFRILREAGLTTTRLDGVNRLVSLRSQDLDARFPGLVRLFQQRPVSAASVEAMLESAFEA